MAKSPKINHDLKLYIEQNIFPEYEKNEPAHNLSHIQYVVKRSLKFAETIPNINYDIVYVVASYHDLGHHIDPERHEIISAEIAQKDKNLARFFSSKELKLIKEAIEDHRASAKHEPRSIYGKIVSTADRNITVEDCLYRTYFYGKNLHPDYTDEELFERSYNHLREKFGENGYAKSYFYDEEYEEFLKEIRKLLSNKSLFIAAQRNYIGAKHAKNKPRY